MDEYAISFIAFYALFLIYVFLFTGKKHKLKKDGNVDEKNQINSRKEDKIGRINNLISKYKGKLESRLNSNKWREYYDADDFKVINFFNKSYFEEKVINPAIEEITETIRNNPKYKQDLAKMTRKELTKYYKYLVNQKSKKLYIKYKSWIEKFLDIAERKVSVLDEYGDEDWDAMYYEITMLVRKISSDEGYSKTEIKEFIDKYLNERSSFVPDNVKYSLLFSPHWILPEEFTWFVKRIEKTFREHHKVFKNINEPPEDFNKLSGIEFETYISKLLKNKGYDVIGTKKTGDQGADLIAKKNGKKIIIQVKRHNGNVGNKAVQEVASAIKYYAGDEGWVITNSEFTKSAKELAQKNKIILMNGWELKKQMHE